MEHKGDILALDGGKLPPVDIITFGSPCQGLSLAGKRLGLADERSGLFSEAIRIIQEMQEATHGKYPKIAIWENVPGALSSDGGRDFRAVLEAFTETKIPMPPSGRWTNAGMVRSQSVDLAWCVYDAQYFGTAQRRRRVFLIADFGGRRAGEILFIPKSLRGYFAAGGTPWQGAAAYFESGAGAADESAAAGIDGYNSGLTGGLAATLGVNCGMSTGRNGVLQPSANCLNPWDTQQSRVFTEDGPSPTLAGADGGGGRNPAGLVYAAFMGGQSATAGGIAYSEKVSPTLRGSSGANMTPCVCEPQLARTLTARGDSSPCADRGQNIIAVGINGDLAGPLPASYAKGTGARNGKERDVVLCVASGQSNAEILNDMSPTLNCNSEQPILAYGFDLQQITSKDNRTSMKPVQPALCSNGNPHVVTHPKISGTLCGSGAGLSRPAGMASETDFCIAYCLQGNMVGREDENGPQGSGVNQEVSFTLPAADQHAVAAMNTIPINDKATRYKGGGPSRQSDGSGNGLGVGNPGDPAPTITAGDRHAVAAVDCRNMRETPEVSGSLQAKSASGGCSLNYQNPVRFGYVVRRLTPVECERLQGYPDGWTQHGHDGKPISDSRRYQMLGNSVAVPCVAYLMQGVRDALEGR